MGSKGIGRPPSADWGAVDWLLPNVDIARRLGLSPQAVAQARVRYAGGVRQDLTPGRRFEEFVNAHGKELNGLPFEEIARRSGVAASKGRAYVVLKRLGVKVGPALRARRKVKMDWRLPTLDLAQVWGLHANSVSRIRRRLASPAALWDGRNLCRGEDPVYRKALEAEQRRAKAPAAR